MAAISTETVTLEKQAFEIEGTEDSEERMLEALHTYPIKPDCFDFEIFDPVQNTWRHVVEKTDMPF